ncbi:hypothetical protein GCM10022252_11520 [Streptosporangium oxazolinicum]|uniref:Transposase n=1 Tax=Streptosporangium oxazolinicum TaxID=909287 RepID=A0ABP8AGT4_9ACTN
MTYSARWRAGDSPVREGQSMFLTVAIHTPRNCRLGYFASTSHRADAEAAVVVVESTVSAETAELFAAFGRAGAASGPKV